MRELPRGIFTIGPGHRFADALARGVLACAGTDPLALADTQILVPTRRAIQAVREAFLRASEGRVTILPHLTALGDVDEPELLMAGDASSELALHPAMPGPLREAMLARLVLAARDPDGSPIAGTAAQGLQLARELAGLVDELLVEGVAFERLETVVHAGFARHWQRTLDFLRIVGRHWPAILAEHGTIDAIDRRNRLLRAQATLWREQPPAAPVIVAGTTGSQPATRELLAAVATLPHGLIVLPGLDRDLDETSWRALDPTHPQHGLRELLAALEVPRDAVRDWPGMPEAEPAQSHVLSEMMRPAATTEAWSAARKPPDAALANVTRVDCATPQQEALVAALALRQVLDRAGRTAALVTPDRELARRVTAELARWGIDADDSAGMPLADTPPATFLRLLAEAAERGFAPVALLALLKHPMCGAGLSRGTLLARARLLDRRVLRGPMPSPGLASLAERIPELRHERDRANLSDLLQRAEEATADLSETMTRPRTGPSVLLDATLRAGEALAATDTAPGSDRLWYGDAGEALALLAVDARGALAELEPIGGHEWPALLATLLRGAVVRPRRPRHPRIAIWGPLEARLQRADRVILGGLNEGTWPHAVETGPWLNRPMRQQLGLPQPERRIGLAAHDFVSAFAADEVLLLRAERADNSPTVPARWLSRLDALLGWEPDAKTEPPAYIERGRKWRAWAEALDRPARERPWPRPEPRPPVEARPRILSVSSIERWRRDPYGLYARSILRLQPLDPLEAEPGAADRGLALHALFDGFIAAWPDALPPDARAQLLARGETELAQILKSPAERAFWWPRFIRLARWFVATETERRARGVRTLARETKGELAIDAPNGRFIVTARADRIDRLPDGALDVIDYKTGRVPTKRELDALFAPQLLLEAAIARAGGFTDVPRCEAVELTYWQTHGRDEGGEIVPVRDADVLAAGMLELLREMVTLYDNPAQPYLPLPWPEFFPFFNDYDHLERQAEWSTRRSLDP
jgi:ATP-dependent helicase/nuclease subunit B